MKARIKWVEDRSFVGESGTGHRIVLGAAHGPEGKSPGPSAMELVLIGLGGCSAYDVVDILEKGRQAIEDVEPQVDLFENLTGREACRHLQSLPASLERFLG